MAATRVAVGDGGGQLCGSASGQLRQQALLCWDGRVNSVGGVPADDSQAHPKEATGGTCPRSRHTGHGWDDDGTEASDAVPAAQGGIAEVSQNRINLEAYFSY